MTTNPQTQERYYGKYRGTVINVEDPMRKGRLLADVPQVLGLVPSTWAMPCVPFAGTQSGMWALPPVGSGVWIEFEQGDPQFPIWTGGFWGSGAEPPALAQASPATVSHIALQTTMQNGLLISDAPGPTGGILLKTPAGATIAVNDTGITISNGKGASITLTGSTVNVNMGALTVT
jgi:uncharacterized protein involved in type VI secretion and phage assembly